MTGAFAKYKGKNTLKGLEGIALSWCMIAGAILLVERASIWFYLPCLFILANRFLALSLYGHEGVHGNLSGTPWLNNFIGRYLCAFPTLTSFSRYKNKHLMHHQFLGTAGDPDLGLYKDFPMSRSAFFIKMLKETLNGKMIYQFFKYYSDLPDLLTGKPVFFSRSVFAKSDFLEYLLFHSLIAALLIRFGLYGQYFKYWLVPLLVCVPYFQMIGALQHAPGENQHFDSRSVCGPRWMMAILLPVNINFHAAHHLHPGAPHYHLAKLSDELHREGIAQWRQSFSEALTMLFTK